MILKIKWSSFCDLNFKVPGGSDSEELAYNIGDQGLIPWSGRSPEEGNVYPLRCSGLENSMERGAWWATVHGVSTLETESRACTIARHLWTLNLVSLIFPDLSG